MNENLNLVDILKNCPRGTKLYSTVYGDVEFIRIRTGIEYPIECEIIKDKTNCIFTKEGKFLSFYDNECTLFPSKDQRDWSKFKIESEMVDGEFYYCCYSHNKKENSFIFIYEKHMLYKTKCYVALSPHSSLLFQNDLITNNNENLTELRKATEEEKQQLLDAIKIRNYEWDFVKKELIKIEPKFDIKTLKPFNKVLVRDNNAQSWRCDFYNSYVNGSEFTFMTICSSFKYKQCVPYNDETKHLVDTKEIPPKKYINWEE